MKIASLKFFGGARQKVSRPGIADLFVEVLQILLHTRVNLSHDRGVNSPATIREAIDAGFAAREHWKSDGFGGIDWVKRVCHANAFLARLGVEVQLGAQGGLVSDLARLINELERNEIDLGVLIVPNADFASALPDSPTSVTSAATFIGEEFEETPALPLILLGVEHDGFTSSSFPVQTCSTASDPHRNFDAFAWDDIQASRANDALQSEHDASHAKALWAKAAKPCPRCGGNGDALSWVYFSTPEWTWQKLCGREGWIVVCDSCRQQTDFFLTIMN